MGERMSSWLERKSRAVAAAAVIAAAGTPLAACGHGDAVSPAVSQPVGTDNPRVGFDVSYPQQGKGLPERHAFAIIGLNKDVANTDNPALKEQYNWAKRSSGASKLPKVAFYVNTADPGNIVPGWPKSGTNKQGACDGSNSAACAYEYGHGLAVADLKRLPRDAAKNAPIWLDVENVFSWQPDAFSNRAALVGMVDTFKAAGHPAGIYSGPNDWHQVVGQLPPTSGLYGLDTWLLGAKNLEEAKANCTATNFTVGNIIMTQFLTDSVDADYAC